MWVMPSIVDQRWEMKVSFNLRLCVIAWSTIVSLARCVVDDVLFMPSKYSRHSMLVTVLIQEKWLLIFDTHAHHLCPEHVCKT